MTTTGTVDPGPARGQSQEHELSQSADQAHPTYDVDDAVNRLRADYDMTPYTSNSYPQSAPGQLAAIGYLFGLDTPEVATARVLEIGCGAGGNLIPFAAAHPRARVVGIDLSQVQIDHGRPCVHALGLNNLQLLAGDTRLVSITHTRNTSIPILRRCSRTIRASRPH